MNRRAGVPGMGMPKSMRGMPKPNDFSLETSALPDCRQSGMRMNAFHKTEQFSTNLERMNAFPGTGLLEDALFAGAQAAKKDRRL